MKIKAKTKDGEIVTIIGTHTDFYVDAVSCIDAKGKVKFLNSSWVTVIDEDYLTKRAKDESSIDKHSAETALYRGGGEMKKRLIDIFKNTNYQSRRDGMVANFATQFTEYALNEVADHLLANGVIVPPISIVGQTVYVPWIYGGTKGVAFFEVTHIIIDNSKSYIRTNFDTDDEGFWEEFNGGQFVFEDFGKTVFLTHEAAEKALEERSKR